MLHKVAGLTKLSVRTGGEEGKSMQWCTQHRLVTVKNVDYFFDNQNTKYFENLCWIRNSVFFSRFLAGQRNPCRGRSVPWPLFGAFDFPRSRTVEVDTFFAICFG